MKEEPDSLSVPYNFARCFNDQCPQASKCLRHIAAQYNGADYLYITSVNPAKMDLICVVSIMEWR